MSQSDELRLIVEPFCFRQFSASYTKGTRIPPPFNTPSSFLSHLLQLIQDDPASYPLVDGYAPFCKHLFVPNFAHCLCGYVSLEEEGIASLVETRYEARRADELPVLVRFVRFDRLPDPSVLEGTCLDIILYSREQILLENEAMGVVSPEEGSDYDYGIVSIKCIDRDSEVPMQPITMFRNALGKEEGGSGVPLVRQKYLESVEFWCTHVSVVSCID